MNRNRNMNPPIFMNSNVNTNVIPMNPPIFMNSNVNTNVIPMNGNINANLFSSEYKNGRLSKGILTSPNVICVGYYNENGLLIEGTKIYSSGLIEDGKFVNNILVKGLIKRPNGDIEKIIPTDDKIIIYNYNTICKGKFENNSLVNGIAVNNCNTIFKGQFENKCLTSGYLIEADDTLNKGIFKDKKIINGIKILSNNTLFGGKFEDSALIHGYTINTDKHIFKGKFKNNKLIDGYKLKENNYGNNEILFSKIKNDNTATINISSDKIHYKLYGNQSLLNDICVGNGEINISCFSNKTISLYNDGTITEKNNANSNLCTGFVKYPDNTLKSGTFHNNELSKGIVVYPTDNDNIKILSGQFKHGEFVQGTIHNSEKVITGKFKNGILIDDKLSEERDNEEMDNVINVDDKGMDTITEITDKNIRQENKIKENKREDNIITDNTKGNMLKKQKPNFENTDNNNKKQKI
jgi:hypothetical protein